MNLPKNFNEIHKTIFRNEIPEKLLIEIFNLMLNTGKLGDKYTVEHYAWCYKEVLKKNGLIQENEDETFTIIT